MLLHITGSTGSGKDTAYGIARDYLRNQLGIELVNIKFSRGIKSALEVLYDLAPNSLDYPEGKALKVPGMGLTFLEVLVLTWTDSQKTIFKDLWLSVAEQKINQSLNVGNWVCLTDLRQIYEMEWLINQSFFPESYRQIYLCGRGKYLESDRHINQINATLGSKSGKPVKCTMNHGKIIELKTAVHENLDELITTMRTK